MSALALKLIGQNKAKHKRGEDATYLDLGDCGITQVPDLSGLTWVTTLVLANSWYDPVEKKSKYSENNGKSNQLSYIPEKGLPPGLQTLILSGEDDDDSTWKLSSFQFLKQVPDLKILDLSYNKISKANSLKHLTELTHLYLNSNKITDLGFLLNLTNLEVLECNYNKISEIGIIGYLSKLTSLELNSNQISDISTLDGLSEITSLNLRSNQIVDISSLGNLTKLETLNLSNNKITELYFSKNTSLTTLNLSRNQINDLDSIETASNLTTLNLRANKITDAGPMRRLIHLKELDLGRNKISNLDFLEPLVKLTDLTINSDLITDATSLGSLRELQTLKLSSKELKNISFIEDLKNLKSLTLDAPKVKKWSYLRNLTKLQHLDLSTYQKSELEDISFLENLVGLTTLILREKQITDLQPFKKLTKLTYLDLRSNQVSDITPLLPLMRQKVPVNLEDSGSGNGIHLFGNPITNPPVEILRKGAATILNYFGEHEKEQFQNTEIKLILIGNATAGKTTLSRYLREKTFSPAQPTTHGIQNFRWQAPGGREMEVSIWDFGGQEYYHATHRLFLSRNAVYALVWDAKTNQGGIEPTEIHYENDPQSYTVSLEHFSTSWWLKNLDFNLKKYTRHEQEGDAPIPILLVQNKCAAGEAYDIQSIPNEFGQAPYRLPARWYHHTDHAAAAMEQLNGELGEWTMRFKLFENELLKTLESRMATYEFATYHRDIRDRVRALSSGKTPVNEMPWSDFEALCRSIEPDANMDLVQIYLRDITGDILYFEKNERLRQRVFLRPDWVCNCIYAILSRKVLESEGLFGVAWVSEALKCTEPEALDFVELMREFELVFPDRDESGELNGQYIAPQYLPEICRKSEYLQDLKEDGLLTYAFTLWYPDFLPNSHMARLIANWGEQAEKRVFWKNGILFKTQGLKVLVERIDEFKIRVDIQPSEKTRRVAVVEQVFKSFLGMEDGQAGFAVSLDEATFVRWTDVEDQLKLKATKVSVYPPAYGKPVDIQPFAALKTPDFDMKKVFISYSKSDKTYLATAKKHLNLLVRNRKLSIWDDTQLLPGDTWDQAVKRELEAADIILFLVSADLLATDYIWDVEMETAMARAEAGKVTVVPVIIRECSWTDAPFGKFSALPSKGAPIATAPDADTAWKEVAEKIGKLC